MRLRRAGVHTLTLFEKAESLGGTWRDNIYPGCACDIPSYLYSLSFELETSWSRKWAPGAEILDYIRRCVDRYQLEPHIRFGVEIASARFHDDRGVWHIRTTAGDEHEAEILVSAVGQLSRPRIPELPGLDSFTGPRLHTAQWDPACEFDGKNVAVVGNAASAVQVVPQLAPVASELRVFQRSANWMMPKHDRPFKAWEKTVLGRVPLAARLYRWWLWLAHEVRLPMIWQGGLFSRIGTALARRNLRRQISDPDLEAKLTPDYPIGGKRILVSDDYYQSIVEHGIEIVADLIDHVTPDALITRDGTRYPTDVLVFATGFETTSFLAPMELFGPDDRALGEVWSEGAEAYLGMSVAGFPNFFMMYGPNTNLGHSSVLYMIECQARYITDCVQQVIRNDLTSIDVRQDIMDDFNSELQRRLSRTVWALPQDNWYKIASGKIVNNWAGSTVEYWRKTRRVDLAAYHCKARP